MAHASNRMIIMKSRDKLLLLVALVCFRIASGIIVDGEKRKDLSATKRQSDEKVMIDAFNTKTCGMADPNYEEHEFVNMAREGQFPWMVSFQIVVPSNSTKSEQQRVENKLPDAIERDLGKKSEDLHFCCGSFISDKWILSAAHCFAPDSIKNYLENDKLKAVAGSHKVSSRSASNRNLTIERIYYHSQFDKSIPVGFDIALVELRDKVEFRQKRDKSESGGRNKPFMNTICLPLKDKKYNFNESARIAGWGLSSDMDATSTPSKLLTTDILLGKNDDCAEMYAKSLKSDRPRSQKERYDDFICAIYKNTRDACQSDSGGPLMQFAGGKAVVIGVVSYGIGCATKSVPGLYTRTSAYINWIKDITMNGKEASVAFKLIEAKQEGYKTAVLDLDPSLKPPNTSSLTASTDSKSGGQVSFRRSTTPHPNQKKTSSKSEDWPKISGFRFFDG